MSKIYRVAFLALLAAAPLPAQTVMGSFEARIGPRNATIMMERRSELGGRSTNGNTYPLSDLKDLVRSGGRVSFKLVRDAGVIAFEGREGDDVDYGSFTFTPSASYRQQLVATGIHDLTTDRQLILAIGDVSVADVKELQRSVTDELDAAQLVRMVNHGATPEFVRGIGAAGFTKLASNELVRTRDHGVTPEFISALRKYKQNLELEDYIRARDHGVTESYISEMHAAGLDLNFEQLVRTRDHGVDASYVREFASAGLGDLVASDYVKLRDHGVDPDYATDLHALGYKDIEPRDLIRLRDHGISVTFIKRANTQRGQRLDVDELIRLRTRGED